MRNGQFTCRAARGSADARAVIARPALQLLLLTLGACSGFRAVGNDVFRCPQPGEDQLARAIAAHGIRTVVSLRGDGDGTAATARAATGAGIAFRNVRMSATRLPKPATLLA